MIKLKQLLMEIKFKKFKDLFKTMPSQLQKRVYNLKKIDQRRDYHPEGNVLKHTIYAVERALKTGDIDLAIAAMLHDVGKDETSGIHPKKGHITHWGHEKVSAKLIKKYRKWIIDIGGTPSNIYYIVKNSGRIKSFHNMRKFKQDKMKAQKKRFGKLVKFSKGIDVCGRGRGNKPGRYK